MKKTRYTVLGVLALTLVLAGCKSNAPAASSAPDQNASAIPPSGPPPDANNAEVRAIPSIVIDWNNRNLGVEYRPGWLKGLLVNNRASAVIQEFGLPDTAVVRVSQAERANREEARVLADLMFAQQIANELKRYVVTGGGQNLNQGQMDIVEQITSGAKVTMTGAQKVTDFWHQVEKEDNGIKSRTYVWYTVYAFPGNAWSQLTRKYVNDVIGQIPDRAVQTQIAQAFGEIDASAKRNNERSDAEFNQMLALQRQAAEDKQKQDMARINQQTALGTAATEAAKAQAEAEAKARFAAYKYGDPATAAAASVTANDYDWISALGTAASIMF
jgi:hypothetical protein